MTQPSRTSRYSRLIVGLVCGLALMAGPAAAEPKLGSSVKVGAGLYEIVHNPATGTVYVAAVGPRGAKDAARIYELDGATLKEKNAIDVSASPLYGLGINTATQTLYGTDTRSGSVSAVDLKTGKVVASIKHGDGAHVREAIVDEATNTVYVSVVGTRGAESSVWVIDGKTNSFSHAIPVPAETLTGIALDAKNNRLFGTAMGAGTVVAIDLPSRKITSTWNAGGEGPTNLVFDAAGNRLFVANQKSGSLTVLDAKSGDLVKAVPTGEGALSVAYNPNTQHVYVANRAAGTVTVVDGKTYNVVSNLKTGTLPQTIAIDRKTNVVYVTNKARGLPRNAPPDAKPVDDPMGDTVTIIHP